MHIKGEIKAYFKCFHLIFNIFLFINFVGSLQRHGRYSCTSVQLRGKAEKPFGPLTSSFLRCFLAPWIKTPQEDQFSLNKARQGPHTHFTRQPWFHFIIYGDANVLCIYSLYNKRIHSDFSSLHCHFVPLSVSKLMLHVVNGKTKITYWRLN